MDIKTMLPKGVKPNRWAEANVHNMYPMQVYGLPKRTSKRCSKCNEHYYDVEFFVPVANEQKKYGFALLHYNRGGGPSGKLSFNSFWAESCITPGCRNSHPLIAVLQQHSSKKSFARMMTSFHKGLRHMNQWANSGLLLKEGK